MSAQPKDRGFRHTLGCGPVTIERVAEARMPTGYGQFRILGYRSITTGEEFVALVKGAPRADRPCLARIHSQCLTGDVFHSLRCDCGPQLQAALERIEGEGCGIVVYQQQEGRGIGIVNKIRAYELQERGLDTIDANVRLGFEADARTYSECAQILMDLGARRIRLMSNNPEKLEALRRCGLDEVERVSIEIAPQPASLRYLKTKKERMGHLLADL